MVLLSLFGVSSIHMDVVKLTDSINCVSCSTVTRSVTDEVSVFSNLQECIVCVV